MKTHTKCLTSCLLALFLTSNGAKLFGKGLSQNVVTLHEAVGPVIDAEENQRFALFGKDLGFTAAKLYQTSNGKWVLHLFGERDGTDWMATRSLSPETKQKVVARLSQETDTSETVIEIDTAGPAERLVRVKLLDGSSFFGHVAQCTPELVHFVTTNGLTLTIPDERIYEISEPEGRFIADRFHRYDPNHIRLFFGPTGRTLKAGESNFSDFYVLFPTFSVGLADDVMIGGGVSLVPGAETQVFYVSAKVRLVHAENLDWAAGLFYSGVPSGEDFATAFSAVSIGNPAGGITLGFALPLFFDGHHGNEFKPVGLMFGAEKQISSQVKLITENWLVTTDGATYFLSGGARFMSDGLTVGFGGFINDRLLNAEGFPIIPWLDFSLSFGK